MSERATRILRIIPSMNISGPAFQALLLSAAMNKMGYEGLLVGGTSEESPSMMNVAASYGLEPLLLPELDYDFPLNALPAFWRLYQLIKEYKPDIVHTHNPRAGFLGRIAARLAGVPVIVHTLHEYPFRGYYRRLSTILFIYMERIGAYCSDSIITLSEGLRKALVETYGVTRKNRITVLPLGFDLQSFANTKRHLGTFRQAWGIAEAAPLVGIVGRLLPVKNHGLFLEAAAKVLASLPNARFVIVGDGEERANLEDLAKPLGDAVIFTGWQQSMEAVYSDLDTLVISSWNEGTPVPIIEALAAGCPVVATNVGGVADLLDGGRLGALVPSGDADALAEAILACLKTRPDMKAAQETMLKRYGIERLAQDMDSLYRGLLAKKRQRA
jgi:glycosyltransferase involved in cell wall biosynthesis